MSQILKLGPSGLEVLAKARNHMQESTHRKMLSDVLFLMKEKMETSKKGKWHFNWLRGKNVEIGVITGEAGNVLNILRGVGGLKYSIDPRISDSIRRRITLDLSEVKLRDALDQVCVLADLDYDFRYGLIWISTPERLWGMATFGKNPSLNEGKRKALDDVLARLGSESIEERTKASAEFVRRGARYASFLEKAMLDQDEETSARVKSLLRTMKSTKRAYGSWPSRVI